MLFWMPKRGRKARDNFATSVAIERRARTVPIWAPRARFEIDTRLPAILSFLEMDEKSLREFARRLLADGRLPKTLPSPERLTAKTPVPAMKIGITPGPSCNLCGEVITAEDGSSACEYRYPSGPTIRFHDRCETIWDQERQGLQ